MIAVYKYFNNQDLVTPKVRFHALGILEWRRFEKLHYSSLSKIITNDNLEVMYFLLQVSQTFNVRLCRYPYLRMIHIIRNHTANDLPNFL